MAKKEGFTEEGKGNKGKSSFLVEFHSFWFWLALGILNLLDPGFDVDFAAMKIVTTRQALALRARRRQSRTRLAQQKIWTAFCQKGMENY